ncbi:helix-turn-helix transcriptional regulator [Actinoplanes oblitus]|uniref:Helix-turn-helix transcriptional regulator n=1 Tax=Actinoplanes oblitus TaxID=3040509 RepID=A0ABY8WRW2_9ACTN|nr:helix-turn-helix transcriptional regulator [Actinoplanes oblitus]WIM99044.1 helix-turn-helix transcriptional regulator [Actinoplanes oblitus]
MDRRTELSEFLRTRRARIAPDAAGVVAYHGRRRVSGLRREEVAQLAGVSVDYYVRLEQGRTTNVSEAILDAVARVLRLDDGERAHLLRLARPGRESRRPVPPQRVRPQVRHLLDAMTDAAAYVVGRRTDVLAWNTLGAALIADFATLPVRQRNFARLLFTDEDAARAIFVDWPAKARDLVAFLHVDAGRRPDDPQLAELIGDLAIRSELFRRLWAQHPVHDKGHTEARLRHPMVGTMDLSYEALRIPGDPDQFVVTYSAAAGSPAAAALRLLGSLHADRPARRSAAPDGATTADPWS